MMNPATVLVTNRLLSLRNGLARDDRSRVEFILSGLIGTVLAVLATIWLSWQLRVWQAGSVDTVQSRLWITVLYTWGALGSLGVLGAIRQAFGSDEAHLLMTMPLTPAQRFRSLWVSVLLDQGGMLLTVVLVYTVSLASTVGTGWLLWLVPLLIGTVAAVGFGVLGLILFVRFLLPRLRLVAGLVVLGILLEAAAVFFMPTSVGQPSMDAPRPLALSAWLSILILCGLFLAAGWAGNQYRAAYQYLEGRGQYNWRWRFPFFPTLARYLAGQRTLTSALMVRALQEQSRHPLVLPRLLILPLYVATFPWLAPRLQAVGFAPEQSVATFSGLLGVLALLELGLAFPLTGEGARLALYLSAPLGDREILRAKALVALAPLLFLTAAVAVVAGTLIDLGLIQIAWAALSGLLVVGGIGAGLIPVSAWDVDLRANPRNGAEQLLQEELPITMRRLQLLGAAGLLLSVEIVLLRVLSGPVLLVVLLLVAVALAAVGWRLGLAGLRHLRA